MRYTVITSQVSVIGPIWQPGITAAMDYTLSAYDVENARDEQGNLTRESVEQWVALNSGDFQSITDFRANIADEDTNVVIEWANEENEFTYNDCMFPEEDF